MSVHLTEEEQLEVLKRWWKDYGKTIIVAVIVVVAAYFAWTAWQDQQRHKAEAASAVYEDLLTVMNKQTGESLKDADRATAEHLASQLKEGDSSSLYAHNAAFFLAKLAVTDGNMDKAAQELNWILANNPDEATKQLANLRLARVLLAKGSTDEALALVNPTPTSAYAAEYAEVYGDALMAKGDPDAARTAYEKALSSTTPQEQERFMLLQMKLDDLKQPSASAAADNTAAEATE